MADFRKGKALYGLMGVCILILFVSIAWGVKSTMSVHNTEKRLADALQAMEEKVAVLEARVKAYEDQALMTQDNASPPGAATTETRKSTAGPGPSGVAKGRLNGDGKGEPQPSATADMDPEILRELYDKAVKAKNLEEQRNLLRDISRVQQDLDKEFYGAEAEALYNQLAMAPRYNLSGDEREKILDDLLTQYPDSFAAAKAVSLAAISAIRNNDLGTAGDYYRQLLDLQNAKGESVVLNTGMEAVPTVSNLLAYAYYRNGNTEKIQPIIQDLETNYTGSLISIRVRGGGLRLLTGKEAADRLRDVTGLE